MSKTKLEKSSRGKQSKKQP